MAIDYKSECEKLTALNATLAKELEALKPKPKTEAEILKEEVQSLKAQLESLKPAPKPVGQEFKATGTAVLF